MSDSGWTHQDKVILGLMVVLGGLIVLSHFDVAASILLIVLGVSVFAGVVLLVWVSRRDRPGRERERGKGRPS